jgi:hypothetical protein
MGQVTELVTTIERELVAQFEVTEQQIADLKDKFADVSFDTPANYEVGRLALATLRGYRLKIEKVRVEAKAEVLERGRLIDKTARKFSKPVEEIEDRLEAAKKLVDDARAKARADAERAELIALEAQQKADREAAEAKAKEVREAEERRIAAEREALEAEKARAAAANAEIERGQAAERARIADERAKLEAEKAAVEEAARKGRQADEERARREQADRARAEAAKAAETERQRLEAIRPEREKVHAFAAAILDLADRAPSVGSEPCVGAISWVKGRLCAIAWKLAEFDKGAA